MPAGANVRGIAGRGSHYAPHADGDRIGSPVNTPRASTPIPISTPLRVRASSSEPMLEDDHT